MRLAVPADASCAGGRGDSWAQVIKDVGAALLGLGTVPELAVGSCSPGRHRSSLGPAVRKINHTGGSLLLRRRNFRARDGEAMN